jgi:hypothetical protein
MAYSDAYAQINRRFPVSHVLREGFTVTLFLVNPPTVEHATILKATAGTGYFVSGYGVDVDGKRHYIKIAPEKQP